MPSAPILSFTPKCTTPLDLDTYIKQSTSPDEGILIDLNPPPLPCLYSSRGCNKTFDLPEELEVHVRATITTDHDHEWCAKCELGFYNLKELKRHWVTCPNDVHHHCPVCGYFEVKSDGSLEIHVQRDHGNVRPGESKMLKCLACDVKVYGAIPMLQHFQVGTCKGLTPIKEDNNATVEELDTRGGVGEKAWPSLGTAATSSPEKQKTTASTIRVFNPIKKEKKVKLNIHKFTAEERAVMSYATPAIAREEMARPAGVGWGDGGEIGRPSDLDWSTAGSKVAEMAQPQPAVDVSGLKRGKIARNVNPAIALPVLPEHKSLSTSPSHQTVSHTQTSTAPTKTSTHRNTTTKPCHPAPTLLPSREPKALQAHLSVANVVPTTKASPSSTPSPTSSALSPHAQDIWDTPIPSTSTFTPSTSSSSSNSANAKSDNWFDTVNNSNPVASRYAKKSRLTKRPQGEKATSQRQFQDKGKGKDEWVDAVQLRKMHLDQTRKNMQSEVEKVEGEVKNVSDWW